MTARSGYVQRIANEDVMYSFFPSFFAFFFIYKEIHAAFPNECFPVRSLMKTCLYTFFFSQLRNCDRLIFRVHAGRLEWCAKMSKKRSWARVFLICAVLFRPWWRQRLEPIERAGGDDRVENMSTPSPYQRLPHIMTNHWPYGHEECLSIQ